MHYGSDDQHQRSSLPPHFITRILLSHTHTFLTRQPLLLSRASSSLPISILPSPFFFSQSVFGIAVDGLIGITLSYRSDPSSGRQPRLQHAYPRRSSNLCAPTTTTPPFLNTRFRNSLHPLRSPILHLRRTLLPFHRPLLLLPQQRHNPPARQRSPLTE
jgi:hypothetical protein